VSARRLRGLHRTLRDCLTVDARVDVAFEILVVLDLEHALDERSSERLSVLAAQGAERGVMLLTLQAAEVPGVDLGDNAVRVELAEAAGAVVPALGPEPVRLDPPAPPTLVRRLAGRPLPDRTALTFAELHESVPTGSSAASVETPIGRSGTDTVSIRLGDDPVHGLVAGIAGSGKSNLLRALVYGLARRYEAQELQLYLLDFKEGVEFQEFAPTHGDPTFLPHAAVVSVNSSREFGLEVLRHLNAVVSERYALFSGAGVAKLAGLRERRPALMLPRVVLVVDEFQRMFDVDDALSSAAVDELVNIAKQGRAAGVHVVLATQSIADVGAGTAVGLRLDGVFKNAALRIGMRLSEAESRQLFGSATNTEAATIHESGVAIVNAAAGAEDFNERTTVAYVSAEAAGAERRHAVTRTTAGRMPPRTFDGSKGADAAANRSLRAVVRGRGSGDLWRCWPGQALRIGADDPKLVEGIHTSFGRDPRRNIAVIGAGLVNALAIVQWSVVGLAAVRSDARFALVDLLRPEDPAEYGVPSGIADATARALRDLGADAELVRDDRASALCDLLSATVAGGPPTAVAVFGGLERLRGLGERPDPDGFDTAEDVLCGRLRDAPVDDMHVIASFATRDDFERIDRGQAFGLRAYLQMAPGALMGLCSADVAVPGGRLALWHDLLNGRLPQPMHCYPPFGDSEIPAWLSR
jgi:hypothetical protein